MGLSDSRPEPFPRLLIPSGRWGSVALPRPAGSPRFLDCSIPARCPQPPRKVRRVLAHCFPADIRLHPIWRTGHLHWRHEAESGSLALRLAGLLPRFPPAGLRRLAPVPLHARTSNLHGEFLKIQKISQPCPGVQDAGEVGGEGPIQNPFEWRRPPPSHKAEAVNR